MVTEIHLVKYYQESQLNYRAGPKNKRAGKNNPSTGLLSRVRRNGYSENKCAIGKSVLQEVVYNTVR